MIMKTKNFLYTVLVIVCCGIAACFTACGGDDDDKDMNKPVISEQGITANPIDCQEYHRGETIPFCYTFTDDVELGNFNIEVHSNHDHHTHSTSAVECEEEHEHEQESVKPWVYNQDYSIPAGQRTYTARVDIAIPTDIDEGDYHFMIRVTDRAGWQELKSVAIRIEE